jgi:hypothetical protein
LLLYQQLIPRSGIKIVMFSRGQSVLTAGWCKSSEQGSEPEKEGVVG